MHFSLSKQANIFILIFSTNSNQKKKIIIKKKKTEWAKVFYNAKYKIFLINAHEFDHRSFLSFHLYRRWIVVSDVHEEGMSYTGL